MPTHFIERLQPISIVPGTSFLAGAGEIDITPPLGFPMAGYSSLGKTASGVAGRLFARSLVLQDRRGVRVALCFVDLMSASRYLLERTASETAISSGIGPARLILAGTHTHTGPGWFYGNSLYDTFATCEPGFDLGLADFLAYRIALSIKEAVDDLRPARVGMAVRRVWGVSRNRSITAFHRNPEASGWNQPPLPGADAPPSLYPEQRSVDPRLTLIGAFEADSRAPIGVFGTFGCHATAIGASATYYSPDWPGAATRMARAELEEGSAGNRVVVAIAPSAAGDVNALRYGLEPKIDPGPGLAEWVGRQVGKELAEGAREAEAASEDTLELDVHYGERSIADGEDIGSAVALAKRWYFGVPTLGGSEESRSVLHALGLAQEGMIGNEFPAADPQHPKMRGLGIVQDILQSLLQLDPCAVLPLHALRLGRQWLVTVPAEPTSVAAYRIEQALIQATGATAVSVLGYCGDYGGYYTTGEEYATQHYEGASTLYGRNVIPHVIARLERVARGEEPPASTSGRVRFDTGPDRERFRLGDDCVGGTDPVPRLRRSGNRLELRWQMPRGCRISFEGRFLVRLETSTNGSWEPVRHQNRDFDDVNQPILVQRIGRDDPLFMLAEFLDPAPDRETWIAFIDLPSSVTVMQPLRISVAARDGFPGFQTLIP
jgi:neutral ceramidase